VWEDGNFTSPIDQRIEAIGNIRNWELALDILVNAACLLVLKIAFEWAINLKKAQSG
jgi:hypothetical protein